MRSPCRSAQPLAGTFAGALAAALLLSPASAVADGTRHATAAAPTPTSISLEQPSGGVRYGSTVSLTARLSSQGKPLGGRPVALYSAGVATASATTDVRGSASFKLKATRNGPYEARFTPTSGDVPSHQPATSKTVTLVVSPALVLGIRSPLRAGRKVVGVPRVAIRVRGHVTPYVPGARIIVRVTRRGREVRRRSRSVVKSGAGGRFALAFKPRRRGRYVLHAEQEASADLGAGAARAKRLLVVRPHAGFGSRGPAVRALQHRLSQLGYATPVNGVFDGSTARAVLALRKTIGMSRTQIANRAVFKRLAKGGGGFRIRYPKAGRHVEFDWSRQVIVLALGSRAVRIIHASSGKPSTPTVFGHFRFYSKTPGYNAKGMYYSNYFVGGYAIHGYADVPTFAASHGCIRIPIPSAISVYRWIALGNEIFVYR